jgi:hypothetical protein
MLGLFVLFNVVFIMLNQAAGNVPGMICSLLSLFIALALVLIDSKENSR